MKGAIVLTLFAILAVAFAGFPDDHELLNKLCRHYGDDYLIPSNRNCAQFYKCAQDQAVAQDCPSGLLFNLARKRCDYPEVTTCSTNVPPPSA